MINLCNKKNKKKNVQFINDSFFNIKFKEKSFDMISANGFIEYISLNQLYYFLKTCRKILKSNGRIILSSRNRLFNLFSLNNFSKNEIKNNKNLKLLFEESIKLANYNLKDFAKLKKTMSFNKIFKQEKTTINVNTRYQFTPSQLINLLNKFRFQTLDLYPINYHPVIPINFNINSNEVRLISNQLIKIFPKINMIPNSSTFMITGKCR